MRKRLWFLVGIIVLLVISFFVGDPRIPNQEMAFRQPVQEQEVSDLGETTDNPPEETISLLEGEKPQSETEEVAQLEVPTCSLTIRCDDILKHPDSLVTSKKELVPADGIILSEQMVAFSLGESVFDVLKRELQSRKIQFEFTTTPMYQSAYIEGIANLYEFDYGDTSGWMYAVNGREPTYGCSQYKLEPGDKVVFFYRCSLFEKSS